MESRQKNNAVDIDSNMVQAKIFLEYEGLHISHNYR